jgi:hypothetical protein
MDDSLHCLFALGRQFLNAIDIWQTLSRDDNYNIPYLRRIYLYNTCGLFNRAAHQVSIVRGTKSNDDDDDDGDKTNSTVHWSVFHNADDARESRLLLCYISVLPNRILPKP